MLTAVTALALMAPLPASVAAEPLSASSAGGAAAPSRAAYIVTLRPGHAASDILGRGKDIQARRTYTRVFGGFAAGLTPAQVEALRRHPAVEAVEFDSLMHLDAAQPWPTWGLDRIDQPRRALNDTYAYDGYGSGVTAYIVDSGVRSHSQFGDRLARGYSANGGSGQTDCAGHGTHVAGTVGGRRFGVAKRVRIVPVRVGGCGAFVRQSDVIAGLDWIVGHHRPGRPAVANMSLGGGGSHAADRAVRQVLRDGITVVAAAGNAGVNACDQSPPRVDGVITVGAVNRRDRAPDWSNHGACVDVFAPGVNITSAGTASSTDTSTLSGTSMAAPHVTGVAARYLAKHPEASPAAVQRHIVRTARGDAVRNEGPNTTSRMLYVPGKVPTQIVSQDDAALIWGTRYGIGATLYNAATKAPMPGRQLVLYKRRPGEDAWQRVAARTTDRHGSIALRRQANRKTHYQVRHLGSTTSVARRDAAFSIDVLPANTRLSISVSDTHVAPLDPVRIRGVLRRDHDGMPLANRTVRLYMWVHATWTSLIMVGETNNDGVVVFEDHPASTTTYDLYFGGGELTNYSMSDSKTVTVSAD